MSWMEWVLIGLTILFVTVILAVFTLNSLKHEDFFVDTLIGDED